MLGLLFLELGDFDKAEKFYRQIIDLDPVYGYWRLSHLSMAENDLSKYKSNTDKVKRKT